MCTEDGGAPTPPQRGGDTPAVAGVSTLALPERDCENNGVQGSGLIRKETAVSESTTEMTGTMIDPVTGEIIERCVAKPCGDR